MNGEKAAFKGPKQSNISVSAACFQLDECGNNSTLIGAGMAFLFLDIDSPLLIVAGG